MISSFFTYLLTAALLLFVGTALYYLSFWRSTFLRWNRVLLWCILAASLSLPLVHLPAEWTIWQQSTPAQPEPVTIVRAQDNEIVAAFYAEKNIVSDPVPQFSKPSPMITTSPYQYTRLLFNLYGAGCLFFGLRFLLQLLSLLKLYRKARIEQKDGYRLVICPGELSPFAFGRSIFVSETLFQNPDLELILTHEQAHVQQRHTLDILAAELNLIWQWFNPGAWLYRRIVERNLEYLADRSVLESWNKKQYQLSLLNWVSNHAGNQLSTSYNFSLLKERIMMMNRKPTSKWYLLRYTAMGMLLPLLPLLNQPLPAKLDTTIDLTPLPQAMDAKIKPTEAQELPLPKPTIAEPAQNLPVSREKEISIPPSSSPVSNQQLPLYVFIGKNPTVAELEKIAQTPLFEGTYVDYTTDRQNSPLTIWLNVDDAGCGLRREDWMSDDFVVMLSSQKKGVCNTGLLSAKQIDQLLVSWDSIRIIGIGGFVATKETFKSIRPSIAEKEALWVKKRLEELEKLNWVEESFTSTTCSELPKEEKVRYVKNMLQQYKTENKPVTIKLNNVIQEELPVLENLKLKKIEFKDWFRRSYEPGTLKIKLREVIAIQLDIFTE